MKITNTSLSSYVDILQANGKYTFTSKEAIAALGCSKDAFRFAALRLIKKNRLARPIYGFYVIIPTEYLNTGCPSPDWFIDPLMQYFGQSYYVGLLSAAALYGAAHQQPQVFQVITTKPIRAINIARARIQFLTKKKITKTSYQQIKTKTGYMNVSTPEMTAFDLVLYAESSGYLGNVVTVLNELQEHFDEDRFASILATENIEKTNAQRLGYLLETIGAKPKIVALFAQWLEKLKPRYIPLRCDKKYKKMTLNVKWRIYVNEELEADE